MSGNRHRVTWKNGKLMFFKKGREKLSASILSTFVPVRSSTRFPALTRLTVHRRRQLVDPTRRDNVSTFG
eukprot:7440289-Pyramimonas_sp.AAC.1